jgi:DNA replication protein DnaC
MWQTPEGRQELEERRKAVYAAASGTRDANAYQEAWRWAQKAGAPYDALAALKRGPEESVALSAARKFNRDSEALFLLLLGPPGVGKTLSASLVVVDFASKWPWNEGATGTAAEPIRFVDAASLTRLSAFDAEAKRYVETLRGCPLLVLEDAGDEGTDLGKGLFVELLMARHAARRRTVVTGNLRPEAFKARYGAAVADRIKSGGYVPALFGEASRRARRGQAA